MQIVAILQALQEAPLTRAELAEDIGYSIYTAERAIQALHRHGLVHIASWDSPAGLGTSVARFAPGPGVDRQRPGSTSTWPQRQRQYRERKRLASMLGLLRAAA